MISFELEVVGWCIAASGVILGWFLHVAYLDLRAINAAARAQPEKPRREDVDPRAQKLVEGILSGAVEHQGKSIPRKDN